MVPSASTMARAQSTNACHSIQRSIHSASVSARILRALSLALRRLISWSLDSLVRELRLSWSLIALVHVYRHKCPGEGIERSSLPQDSSEEKEFFNLPGPHRIDISGWMVKAPICMFSHAVTSILLVRLTHLQRLSQRNAHPPCTFCKIFLMQSAATPLAS